MQTFGIFSKLGMPGGSENRVTQLANCLCKRMTTYIFAEKEFSKKLKPQLDSRIILREHTTETKRFRYELQGIDTLLVINSDSYSFCKKSYWNGSQGKHHTHDIDISQIPSIGFLYNYVVSPAQNLVELSKINPNLKILCTADWFVKNIKTENKFEKLRELNLPIRQMNSPVSKDFDRPKTPSDKIRINRHSMAFSYKHDEDNLRIVETLCKKYGDKISFKWMGVPSHVRDTNSKDKKDKVPYRDVLAKHKQMQIVKEYSMSVPDLLRETDILFFDISRHRKEPWPRTIAEGMMAGCCCVSNNAYGMKEQIINGECGFLFDTADQAIEQLSYLIDNPEKIKEFGDKGKERAIANWLDEVVVDQTLEFLVPGLALAHQ